ncbi:Thioredoxin [Micractinium conductrix]|uniref:Thioredoxin n=1 Tax=Micractinium conductrix TaxID=554055 RepID=A0A2P6UZU3_9CHLO|nr:Thioredoxin [Micractinium conductrix]|eukprot:PSC67366.1 Thioredoxin [Micractinium conductrix]
MADRLLVEQILEEDKLQEVLKRERLQVIELYTEWAGPTAAARSAWRKMATELGEPLPFDLGSAPLERMRGVQQLAGFTPSAQPQWVLFKGGKQVAAVTGLDLLRLTAAAQRARMLLLGAATVSAFPAGMSRAMGSEESGGRPFWDFIEKVKPVAKDKGYLPADDGLDALREELAGSAPAATREDKLAAALAKLVKEEQKYLLWYKEARDQGNAVDMDK